MPTYSYNCTCGSEFDAYAHIEHRDRVKCGKCGQKAKRVYKGIAIVIPDGFRACPEDYMPVDARGQKTWNEGVKVGRDGRAS